MYKQHLIRNKVLIFVLVAGLIAMSTGCAGAATTSVSSTTARVPGSLDFPLQDESFKSTFAESLNSDTNKTDVITRSEGSYVNRSFTQSIEFSDAAVIARLVSRDTDKDGTIRNRMAVSNAIYGDITEPVIHVHQTSSEFGQFIENVDYVLILNKVDIVTNPGPRYYLVDNCEFRLDEKKERFTVKTRAERTMTDPFVESYQAFEKMILSIKSAQSKADPLSKSQNRYVISDDLNFIYQYSEVVARVRMDQQVITGTYAVQMIGSVLEVYKGKLTQNVRINMFFGPKVGEDYLVMLNATLPGQEQTSYSLSSKNSQFSVDSKEYARFRGTYFE